MQTLEAPSRATVRTQHVEPATLSVVIPVYNERRTIADVLVRVIEALPSVQKEIVIVDDRSKDGTTDWLRQNLAGADLVYNGIDIDDEGNLILTEVEGIGVGKRFWFRVLFHERNRGKGGALQTGLSSATGDVIVIQDADLEYDPFDWSVMFDLIAQRRVADVVYGSRFSSRPHRSLYYHHLIANKLISFLFNILYNQALTDIEVCYKMFSQEVLQTLSLSCDDFGIEIELSTQIAKRRKWRIYEMGISYYGRTYAEGKKINWRDGIKALWYLVKYRF
jgi:glycosyltransferase involved in cell wall biosynthesis